MKEDITLSKDKNDNIIVAKGADYVRNTIHMLFAMEPGTDEFDSSKGLGLKSKVYSTEEKLSGYSRDIEDQFNKYTDLTPSDVVVTLRNGVIAISMTVSHEGNYYSTMIGASKNDLSVVIE